MASLTVDQIEMLLMTMALGRDRGLQEKSDEIVRNCLAKARALENNRFVLVHAGDLSARAKQASDFNTIYQQAFKKPFQNLRHGLGCELCGDKKARLETAHRMGHERATILARIMKEATVAQVVRKPLGPLTYDVISVSKLAVLFYEAHLSSEKEGRKLLFLCHQCHVRYDNKAFVAAAKKLLSSWAPTEEALSRCAKVARALQGGEEVQEEEEEEEEEEAEEPVPRQQLAEAPKAEEPPPQQQHAEAPKAEEPPVESKTEGGLYRTGMPGHKPVECRQRCCKKEDNKKRKRPPDVPLVGETVDIEWDEHCDQSPNRKVRNNGYYQFYPAEVVAVYDDGKTITIDAKFTDDGTMARRTPHFRYKKKKAKKKAEK